MSDIITVSIDAAKEAGKFLVENFGKIREIQKKGDRNFATNVDKEAEKLIVEKIKMNFPDHGIIGEEGGEDHSDREYLWIIDPLDGTHNFMRDIEIFGVSIGVVHKGQFVAGVIYMPGEDHLYVGEKGNGAYKNNRKISVSSTTDLKECSISFDSSIRYAPEVMLATLGDLAEAVFNVRMFGSSVRVLSYIAEGKLDAAVEFHDRPWDFSGGVCIVQEAGGKFCDLYGGPMTYKTIGYVVANPHVHEPIHAKVLAHLKKK